jgi:hypothetical protein
MNRKSKFLHLTSLKTSKSKNFSSILHIAIGPGSAKLKSLNNNINLQIENIDESGYITSFLRIVMPLAYQVSLIHFYL